MDINNEVPPDETEDRGTNKYNLRLQSFDTRYPIPTVQPSVRPDSLPQRIQQRYASASREQS